jgi:hypothetical protein
MSLPWPTECAVEHLFDSTQGDPIVLRTDQEKEAGEGSVEKLRFGSGQVFDLRDIELFPQLFTSADLLSTGVATSRAILWREDVGWGAVLEHAGLLRAVRSPLGSRASLRRALDGALENGSPQARDRPLGERAVIMCLRWCVGWRHS